MITEISQDTETAMSIILKQDGMSTGYRDLSSCDCIITNIFSGSSAIKKMFYFAHMHESILSTSNGRGSIFTDFGSEVSILKVLVPRFPLHSQNLDRLRDMLIILYGMWAR